MARHAGDVTVIIPCYNGVTRGYVFRALDSVLAQTVAPRQIILVDDGSTDATAAEVSSRYPGVTVRSKPNGGLPSARNFGLQFADTSFVCFLDDDDEWEPAKLERQLQFMMDRPAVGLGFSAVTFIDAQGNVLGEGRATGVGLGYPAILLGNSVLPPSAVMFRRSTLDRAGPFDESLKQCEDYEYFIRCAKVARLAYQDEALVRYRKHANQMSGTLAYIDDVTLEVIERHARSDFPADVVGRIVRHFCYGASVRALARRDFADARRYVRRAGSRLRPVEYLMRLVGISLTPVATLKRPWRRFEHGLVLRGMTRFGALPGQ